MLANRSAGTASKTAAGGAGSLLESQACPYGLCEGDGWVVDEDARTAYDCPCRRREILRRRRGGRPPRCRSRQEALAFVYPVRRPSRHALEQAYEAAYPRPAWDAPAVAHQQWERGRETVVAAALADWRLYRVGGQHSLTTNEQRRLALEHAGRSRSRRTIQRVHRILEQLGVARYSHVRRGGAQAGNRDCLCVEYHGVRYRDPCARPPRRRRRRFCADPHTRMSPRPYGAAAQPPYRGQCAAAVASQPTRSCESAQARGAPRTTAPDLEGEEDPMPHLCDDQHNPGKERRWELEQAIQFRELELRVGFGDPARIRRELEALRRQLTRLESDEE
jgi:hypothetical protein